jgi:hypothetical protein
VRQLILRGLFVFTVKDRLAQAATDFLLTIIYVCGVRTFRAATQKIIDQFSILF